MEALDTFLLNKILISSSFPSKLDDPWEPLGRPSILPFVRAAANPSHVLCSLRN